jgi:hypothetical protein
MNTDELNQFIETDDGKAWLESQKKPLIDKRDELLSEIKTGSARIEEATQRAATIEQSFEAWRNAAERAVLDEPLKAALRNAGAFDSMLPGLLSSLKETHGLKVDAGGEGLTLADKEGKPASIQAIIEGWRTSPEGQEIQKIRYGAKAPMRGSATAGYSIDQLKAMSADQVRELMNDPAFMQTNLTR